MPIDEFNTRLGLPQNSYMGLWSTKKLDIPAELLSGTKSLSETADAMDEGANGFRGGGHDPYCLFRGLDYHLSCNLIDY